MQRELTKLRSEHFDLIVIGGGIYGVSCAREAALRGLKVLLLEQDDFGHATSANSSKIAHSGLRYLQHLDFKRMRESIRERNLLIRNAPHLVNSQPFLFPIYGHGIKGKEVMTLYMKLFDLLSPDRKAFKDPARRIGDSRIISKEEVLRLAPNVNEANLTGGAIWFEGQIHNTERMVISLIHSAQEHGASFINYMKVTRLAVEQDKITSVEAQDRLTGEHYQLNADYIINACGPWLEATRALTGRPLKTQHLHGSKALSLLTRSLCDDYALSFSTRQMYNDKKAILNKGSSIQFAIPWRGLSLIGSLHQKSGDDPADVTTTEEEIQTYLEMINEGLPKAQLKREDIKHILWGMIPAEEQGSAAPRKHYKLLDHQSEDNIQNFISVMGVKFTTARDVAKKAIDLLATKMARPLPVSISHKVPVWGGDIKYLERFMEQGIAELSPILPLPIATRLLKTYGTRYGAILALAQQDPDLLKPVSNTEVLRAELLFAIKEEMAVNLSDLIFRRTDLGSLRYPGAAAIEEAASFMAGKLGWSEQQQQQQIAQVTSLYTQYWPDEAELPDEVKIPPEPHIEKTDNTSVAKR